MKFLTLSKKQLTNTGIYTSLQENHLLISVRDPGNQVDIPKSPYCKAKLELEFLDLEYFTDKEVSFDTSMARNIIDFVNNHCSKASYIVCQCEDGISRSAAIASALSKILNHKDDIIFGQTVPNMFIYMTILDEYFLEENTRLKWSAIHYLRDQSMKNSLDLLVYRSWERKVKEREKHD